MHTSTSATLSIASSRAPLGATRLSPRYSHKRFTQVTSTEPRRMFRYSVCSYRMAPAVHYHAAVCRVHVSTQKPTGRLGHPGLGTPRQNRGFPQSVWPSCAPCNLELVQDCLQQPVARGRCHLPWPKRPIREELREESLIGSCMPARALADRQPGLNPWQTLTHHGCTSPAPIETVCRLVLGGLDLRLSVPTAPAHIQKRLVHDARHIGEPAVCRGSSTRDTPRRLPSRPAPCGQLCLLPETGTSARSPSPPGPRTAPSSWSRASA